jgi:pilus assembly protein TadC
VKLVIPLVLLLLPAIFLVVLGPAVLQIMHSGLFQH